MMTSQIKNYTHYFLLLFIVLCGLGNLKLYISSLVYWLLTTTSVLLFCLANYRKDYLSTTFSLIRQNLSWTLGWGLLISGIIVSDYFNNVNNTTTIIKFLIFFLLSIALMEALQTDNSSYKKGLILSLILNFVALVVLILLKQIELLVVLGDGRSGWLFNWPGKLWYVGAFLWPFIFLKIITTNQKVYWCYAFLALTVMALDGSRTAMLWILLTTLPMILITFIVINKKKWGINLLLSILLIAFIYGVIQPISLSWIRQSGSFISNTNTNTNTPPLIHSRIIGGETSTRARMIQQGIESSINNFPIGSGLGTTTATEADGSQAVIHMTYLQILADIGFLSFLGYFLILITPIVNALRFIFSNKNKIYQRFQNTILPLSIFGLFTFTGLLHPLSNELTEWGIIIIAASLLMNLKNLRH